MYAIYILLLGYSLFRGVRGCVRILSSYGYIKNDKAAKRTKKNKIPLFHVLIPVLREQEIIEETIEHFTKLKGNYKVYFITTEKEIREKNHSKKIPAKYKHMPTTKEVAEHYLDKHPKYRKKIKIIHSPNTSGVVAHQFNYALNTLSKVVKNNDFIITYNADSRVDKNILNQYAKTISENNDCLVVQQSAAFLKNFNNLSSFLKAIALLQTRWTLAHEIPRIRKTTTKLSFLEGAHVVAHGLCINYGFFKKIGFFPEDILNEDLPLGYFIRLHGAKIYLLRNLENAETPNSIKSMFNQYRTWFYAPFYYPENIMKALKNIKFNKYKALYWGIKYTLRGLLWFVNCLGNVVYTTIYNGKTESCLFFPNIFSHLRPR